LTGDCSPDEIASMTAREVIGKYLAAMQAGDREAALAMYADDVVMHVPGRSPFAGERRGREAAVAYMRAALERADGGAELDVIDVLAGDGDRVALLLRERLRGTRGEVVLRRANVYTVRDDRIAEIRIFEHDQYAVDAYLGA
jgi:ketosteroid isomerase-like protein